MATTEKMKQELQTKNSGGVEKKITINYPGMGQGLRKTDCKGITFRSYTGEIFKNGTYRTYTDTEIAAVYTGFVCRFYADCGSAWT